MKPAVFNITRSGNHLFPILAAGLAFAYLLAISVPALMQSGTGTRPAAPQPAAPQDHPIEARQDFTLISEFHLFGHPGSAFSSPDGIAPETAQQITLKGVFYLAGNDAHAIIESADQSQKTYKINDTLPGGAILQAIENNRIILMTDKRQESLFLSEPKSGRPAPAYEPFEPQAADEEVPEPFDDSSDEPVIQPPESLAN